MLGTAGVELYAHYLTFAFAVLVAVSWYVVCKYIARIDDLKARLKDVGDERDVQMMRARDAAGRQEGLQRDVEYYRGRLEEEKKRYADEVAFIRRDSLRFPVLLELWERLQGLRDDEFHLCMRLRAPRAAEVVAEVKRERRALFRENVQLRAFVELYRNYAPWLEERLDCTVAELADSLRDEQEFRERVEKARMPEVAYMSADEYERLSDVERAQLALDRYWQRARRSLWLVGVEYERYVGFLYERDGYRVTYYGALHGKEDLGVDLVAVRGGVTHVVQCKRYSALKRIPVRENAVAQVFGAAAFFKAAGFARGRVRPVIVTSFELSQEARDFAQRLGVLVREGLPFDCGYPCIKCNVGRDGERIFHLPFDQQYDSVRIEPDKGEFYAATVQEACEKGFRRAFRWHGGA